MKESNPLPGGLKNQRGSIIIFFALALIMLLGFGALAVDIGHITVTKNELQNISDAASLAATGQLGAIYKTMSYEDQQNYVADPAPLIAIAKDVGLKNQAGKMNITINDADVIIGTWNPQTKQVEPNPKTGQWLDQPDAVRVIGRRDNSSAEGPLSNIFANILGKPTTNVEADATAALTGRSTAGEGDLPIPVGISKARFESPYCDREIHFYPTNDPLSCGGWHTYTGDIYSPNAGVNGLPALLTDLKDGNYTSPETKTGTIFTFTGGTLASVFDEMKALFEAMKDPTTGTWTTGVVVYDSADCSNPNPGDTLTVKGFAEITITAVLETPEKIIEGVIKCNYVAPDSRGGGGEYGTKGSIPGLVE